MTFMNWTTKKPDRPGWWWWRNHEKEVSAVEVFASPDNENKPALFFIEGGWCIRPEDTISGQWSDRPIPEPGEKGDA